MANQYSLDLSKNVKRGNKTKIEKGGFCGRAPAGYLNDKINKTIIKDPERFAIVRKMFQLYLTENYSLSEVFKIVNTKFHYRSLKTAKMGGVTMKTSTLYSMFNNPFYYGQVHCGGIIAQGNHPAMLSKSEFERIQTILQKQGFKLRRLGLKSKNQFAYTGIFTCGECHCSITAETKTKYRCPKCKKRHASRHPKICSCGHPITQTTIRKRTHYTYYRCTKKKKTVSNMVCSQACIRDHDLEQQVFDLFQQITLSNKFIEWANKTLLFFYKKKNNQQEQLRDNYEKQIKKIQLSLDNLLDMYLENRIDEKRYAIKNETLEKESEKLKNNIKQLQSTQWIKKVSNTLEFMKTIQERFPLMSIEEKKIVFRKIGSNHTLHNNKIALQWAPKFKSLLDLKEQKNHPLELALNRSISDKSTCKKYINYS